MHGHNKNSPVNCTMRPNTRIESFHISSPVDERRPHFCIFTGDKCEKKKKNRNFSHFWDF
jgi:hypothetical protein